MTRVSILWKTSGQIVHLRYDCSEMYVDDIVQLHRLRTVGQSLPVKQDNNVKYKIWKEFC